MGFLSERRDGTVICDMCCYSGQSVVCDAGVRVALDGIHSARECAVIGRGAPGDCVPRGQGPVIAEDFPVPERLPRYYRENLPAKEVIPRCLQLAGTHDVNDVPGASWTAVAVRSTRSRPAVHLPSARTVLAPRGYIT